jgi:hypothetical protein
MPIAKHASDITNGIEGDSPPPGFTSVASATGTPADQFARGCEASELEEKGRRGQERGDRAGASEFSDAFGRDLDEMIR